MSTTATSGIETPVPSIAGATAETATTISSTTEIPSTEATALLPSSSPASKSDDTNVWIYVSYGTIVCLWGLSQVILIPYVLHLLILVTAILYAACHMSLQLREEAHPEEKDENGDPVELEPRETLKASDAYQFPLIGSVTLFSLYLAFKYLNKDWVNFLIGFYFGIVGCFAITMTIAPPIDAIVNKLSPKTNDGTSTNSSSNRSSVNAIKWDWKWNHSMPTFIAGPSPFEVSISISIAEIIAFPLAIGICGLYYYLKRPWYINNILGVCFCLQGIEKFSLGTYKIGAILLIGLFFYDIFWVFGTEVMVTVAKNLDGPIKILFPRGRTLDGKLELSLLGLGDIVIPGFFLALLLRFDAHNANVGIHYVNVHENFPKPYFHSALLSYVAGLGVTMFVMIYFQAAQPALLYLVPACLGSSFLCATVRGEIKQLFDYTEEQDEEGDEDDEKLEETKDSDDTTKDVTAKKDD